MVIDLIAVLEDGSQPAAEWVPRDPRRALEAPAGEQLVVRVQLVTRAGVPVVLAEGDTLTMTARESTQRPSRKFFHQAAVATTTRGRYTVTVAGVTTRFLGGLSGVWDLTLARAAAESFAVVPTSAIRFGGRAVDQVAP